MAWLDDYENVADRIGKWWADHPHGRIETTLVDGTQQWLVKAAVFTDQQTDHPRATGYARNPLQNSGKGAQATHPLEDAETSAIGRALANAGYSTTGQRPSREEMAQAEDRQSQPQPEDEPEQPAMTAAQDHVAKLVTGSDEQTKQALGEWWNEQGLPKRFPELTDEQCQQVMAKVDELEAAPF